MSPHATGATGLVSNPRPAQNKKKIIRLLIAASFPTETWTMSRRGGGMMLHVEALHRSHVSSSGSPHTHTGEI